MKITTCNQCGQDIDAPELDQLIAVLQRIATALDPMGEGNPAGEFLTCNQAAAMLGEHPSTMMRRIRRGGIPSSKRGSAKSAALMIRRSDVLALVASWERPK